MTIEESIKSAMAAMIKRKLSFTVEVTSWEEEFERGWFEGCGTCGYGADEDKYYVDINYTVIANNSRQYYRHEGSFAELIRELDSNG